MGQEVGVTPLQIVDLVSAVANGGIAYRPHVVKRVEHPVDGVLRETELRAERIISAATADQLKNMLEIVVTEGTAKSSKLEGYRAAGKTGTAQKVEDGRYSGTKFVASFTGFAPVSNPVLAMIVVVDEPKGQYHGADVAAPVFKRAAEQILRYLSVAPDVPRYAPQYSEKDPQELREQTPPAMPRMFPGENRNTTGDWKVIDASFSTLAALESRELGGIAVPDFYGKSLRQVTEECLKLGLRVRSTGSGVAVEQFPPAGTNVSPGARIQVKFSTRR
jgi:stage V sporulation protein D (sporulation-specific penicillin-binding protein)